MQVVLPPSEIFQHEPKDSVARLLEGGYAGEHWVKTVCPPGGGVLSYYEDHPFPRKGHVYPEAVTANNTVKRLAITLGLIAATTDVFLPLLGFLLIPFKRKVRWLTNTLVHFNRMAEGELYPHYLKAQFYTLSNVALWQFVYDFLVDLGVDSDTALRFGKVVCTMLEYDDAYRLRFQDLMTETTKSNFLSNPRREVDRLRQIFESREPEQGKNSVGQRFKAVFRILRIALLHPRVRRAFRAGLKNVHFADFYIDDIDYYWCLNRSDYNFFGRTLASRRQQYANIYNRHTLKRFKEHVINQQQPNVLNLHPVV